MPRPEEARAVLALEPGRIQVTSLVHERLKDAFEFEPRGQIEVKGKGEMETWYLVGAR